MTRIEEIVSILKKLYPGAKCTLDHEDPFQLLVATILAAQSTDAKVNEVTIPLFKKYKTPADFASADPAELEVDIHATGFFRQKAKAIIEASQDIVNVHGGKVPDNMEDLVKLPGVGRKTANVILGSDFGKPAIIVDTHMIRISGRLGLVDQKLSEKKDAEKIEQELMKVLPEKDWTLFSHSIVALGRDLCDAKKPRHSECPLLPLCPTGQSSVASDP